MKLRFIAREDGLATIPGSRANIGQAAFYIGRTFSPPDKAEGKGASYPATEAPHEVELDLSRQDEVIRFNRYVKLAKRGDIWPADEETANACGIALPAVGFSKDAGEWRLVAQLAPQPPGNSPN